MADIREKAEALIRLHERMPFTASCESFLDDFDEYKELKAALTPSRGEISDHLQTIVNFHYKPEKDAKWIWYAIEELRK